MSLPISTHIAACKRADINKTHADKASVDHSASLPITHRYESQGSEGQSL
jgi:hypothetical protein